MNNKSKLILILTLPLLLATVAVAQTLPTEYAVIDTTAQSTFGWAKLLAIAVVGFSFVMYFVRKARKG